MSKESSYGQILKSSSIIGGAQGINYLIGMIRTKLVAILLGPTGVGLIGLFTSVVEFVGTVSRMGVASSGVREVAEAHGSGNTQQVARTAQTLRRVCWVTGAFGWLLTILLAYPLSKWAFGSVERAAALAMLGLTLLLGAISGGQTAILQGTRRIGDIARLNIIGAITSTIVAVVLYAWLGERGIVPVLISTAALNLAASWWFARRVPMCQTSINWYETWHHSKRLLALGLAFMWSAFLYAIAALVIRAVIVRKYGLDENGIYQAAWGISGVFAGFILGAMGTDFYPRLAAVSKDNEKMNRLINEQTEIGILLALPGLLGTLAFAPWIIKLLYSIKFIQAAELLPWFVLGVFGQVISWPMGFAIIAKGSARWHALTETSANVFRAVLAILLMTYLGLWGAALAVAILYVGYTCLVYSICRHLTYFRWSDSARKLILLSSLIVIATFVMRKTLSEHLAIGAGVSATVFACLFCLKGIVFRLGKEHRISKTICEIPFACKILSIR